MSFVSIFSAAEQDLLIGCLYRAGHFVSCADDPDLSEDSEKAEHDQLLKTLSFISSNRSTSEFVRELAGEALRHERARKRWVMMQDQLTDDLKKAVKLIQSRLPDEEISHYKHAIMLVAGSVARAVRELPDEQQSNVAEFFSTLTLRLTDRAAWAQLNISPSEDDALQTIFESLKG